ncbi:hypothetical protein ACFVZJ_04050 [Streptomyces sp. NPDC058322]|uniref:hypothetical protein n=1 Tax=unclassified Streptomyces TaxID=2593676 RepID=UPI0036EA5265
MCQLRFWIDTRVELIEALVADLPALRESLLAAPGPQRLERLEFGAGDKHRREVLSEGTVPEAHGLFQGVDRRFVGAA